MKKEYDIPELLIIEFAAKDMLTKSVYDNDPLDDQNNAYSFDASYYFGGGGN